MENYILNNCRAILENRVEPDVCIIVRDGRIHSIEKDVPPDTSIQIIDADNRYVSPGLVEFHIHGCEDASVDYAVHQDGVLRNMKDCLLKYGVTTFVPALMADPKPDKPEMDVYSAVRWSAASKYGVQGMQVVVSLVLARLLAPEYFGLLGMAMVITGFEIGRASCRERV